MHIERIGQTESETPVVIIGGLPQPPDDLAGIGEALAERFEVHLVHLPGYGKSDRPALPYDLDAVQGQLAAALGARLDGRPAILIGMSGGSYRSFDLAVVRNLPVRAIGGLGPLAYIHEANRTGLAAYADAVDAGIDMVDMGVARMYSKAWREAHPEAARAGSKAMLTSIAPADFASELRAFSKAPDLRESMRGLDVPVYLRVGSEDVATPPELSEALLDLLPDVRLEVVDGVGHMIHHEAFDSTAAALLAFCEEVA